MVDLSYVLDKTMTALERCERNDIKLELIKSYLTMLHECSDRAALKIAIVSKDFFVCLLEQLRLNCQIYNQQTQSDNLCFLHEFIKNCLNLVKNLLENSQSVKVLLLYKPDFLIYMNLL